MNKIYSIRGCTLGKEDVIIGEGGIGERKQTPFLWLTSLSPASRICRPLSFSSCPFCSTVKEKKRAWVRAHQRIKHVISAEVKMCVCDKNVWAHLNEYWGACCTFFFFLNRNTKIYLNQYKAIWTRILNINIRKQQSTGSDDEKKWREGVYNVFQDY